jgi:hypothetical protein
VREISHPSVSAVVYVGKLYRRAMLLSRTPLTLPGVVSRGSTGIDFPREDTPETCQRVC